MIRAVYGKPGEGMTYAEAGQLSTPSARPGLRLLCLLVQTRNVETRSLPVHTMRPMPPRIPQVPSSAPIYDELTRPVSFPRLYCMSSTDPATYAREFGRMAHAVVNGTPTVCQCYTQQSTRVETDFAFCMRVVENGFFDPTLPDRSPSAQTQHAQNTPPPTTPPAHAAAVQPAGGPNLTVVPYQKGQFLW